LTRAVFWSTSSRSLIDISRNGYRPHRILRMVAFVMPHNFFFRFVCPAIAGILLVSSLTAFSLALIPGEEPPRELEITPRSIDFSKLPPNEKRSFQFTIKNNSESLLRIVTPAADCGCLVMSRIPKTLEPHSSFDLSGEFSTGDAKGVVERHIFLRWVPNKEGAQLTTDVLNVKADVEWDYDFSPRTLVFNSSAPKVASISFTRSDQEPPLEIESVSSFEPALSVSKPQTISGRNGRRIDVNFDPSKLSLGPSSHITPISIKTNSTRMPLVHVEVYVTR